MPKAKPVATETRDVLVAPQEIERKFKVKRLPENLDQYKPKKIRQGYLAIMEDGTEVRLRQKGEGDEAKYFQTVKSGGGKTRNEYETEITEEQFNVLWQATEGKRVEKTRYEIPQGKHLIEVDVFDEENEEGKLYGLTSVEVEFESEEDSDEFETPDWFGEEITTDKRYKNQTLALHGIPEDYFGKKSARAERVEERSDIPEYDLEEGLGVLVDTIKEKKENSDEPIIVEIAGGSASGKTSAVSEKVHRVFGKDSLVLSMDDYGRGKAYLDEQAEAGNPLTWDEPGFIDFPLLKKHLQELKEGHSIEKPIYSFKKSGPDGTETVKPKPVIIVEGLFALNDQIKDEADVKAFVDIGMHGRILRRLMRDVERTGQAPKDIFGYFNEVVEPMHDKHVQSTKKNADIIIKNEYNPQVEAERSGLHELQLKFQADISAEQLRHLGADRLSQTTQIDRYYNPSDRDLSETGETLRIREEGDARILTYKGPKVESKFRERPKLEFEIDADMEKKFLELYGDQIQVIKKKRVLYSLDGVVFSIDQVKRKVGDEKEEDMGTFLEIRSAGGEDNNKTVKKVIAKLGLDMKDGIREAYSEM